MGFIAWTKAAAADAGDKATGFLAWLRLGCGLPFARRRMERVLGDLGRTCMALWAGGELSVESLQPAFQAAHAEQKELDGMEQRYQAYRRDLFSIQADERCVCGMLLAPETAFCGYCGCERRSSSGEAGNCWGCGAAIEEGARFCAACGQAAATGEECRACGRALRPGAQFCPGCGAKIEIESGTPKASRG